MMKRRMTSEHGTSRDEVKQRRASIVNELKPVKAQLRPKTKGPEKTPALSQFLDRQSAFAKASAD
jgi:hypothetical protein